MRHRRLEVDGAMPSLISELAASFRLQPIRQGLRDRRFWICCLGGVCGLFFDYRPGISPFFFLAAPLLEEVTWRALCQAELEKILPGRLFLFSRANVFASCLFALSHVFFAPHVVSLLTFFPSLCIGFLWTRFRSVLLCTLLHIYYNAILLW